MNEWREGNVVWEGGGGGVMKPVDFLLMLLINSPIKIIPLFLCQQGNLLTSCHVFLGSNTSQEVLQER